MAQASGRHPIPRTETLAEPTTVAIHSIPRRADGDDSAEWGNSQGIRSVEPPSNAGIEVGDEVQGRCRGALIVTPWRRVRGGHDLRSWCVGFQGSCIAGV